MAEDARNQGMKRLVRILNTLIEGGQHDRKSISEVERVTPQTADRDMAVLSGVVGVFTARAGKQKFLRFRMPSRSPPSIGSVVAAALGASLASLFEGTTYEVAMRDGLEYLASAASRSSTLTELDRKFFFVRQGGDIALPQQSGMFDDLVDAILSNHRISVKYRRFGGEWVESLLCPLSLAIYDHQIYLIAMRQGSLVRPIRFSRIVHLDVLEKKFRYPPASEYSPHARFETTFGIFIGQDGEPEEVVLELVPKWQVYAQTHHWHASQRVHVRPDGIVEVRLHLRMCPELEAWILGFGEDARVVAPESLAVRIRARIIAMAGKVANDAATASVADR